MKAKRKPMEITDKPGAAVCAKSAAVGVGYCPHEIQVSQTGNMVSPELDITGAIPHLAGSEDRRHCRVKQDPQSEIYEIRVLIDGRSSQAVAGAAGARGQL